MSSTEVVENIVNFNDNNLEILKERFASEINSKRRLEAITTIEELYAVLEDRNALTEDTLSLLKPSLKSSAQNSNNNLFYPKEINIPSTVVELISENCTNDLRKLGEYLGLSEGQLDSCLTCERVLLIFQNSCGGISPNEMIYRLTRALEKCGKGNLKPKVLELMKANLL